MNYSYNTPSAPCHESPPSYYDSVAKQPPDGFVMANPGQPASPTAQQPQPAVQNVTIINSVRGGGGPVHAQATNLIVLESTQMFPAHHPQQPVTTGNTPKGFATANPGQLYPSCAQPQPAIGQNIAVVNVLGGSMFGNTPSFKRFN